MWIRHASLLYETGGGSLRAFRRAGFIFDAVLFDSYVDGVAAAMAVASIFLSGFFVSFELSF